jgi:hypothetical protein
MKVMISGTMRMISKIDPGQRTWKAVEGAFQQNEMVETFEEPVNSHDVLLKTKRNSWKTDGSPDIQTVKEVKHLLSHSTSLLILVRVRIGFILWSRIKTSLMQHQLP